jgi:hypothetical protein
MNFKYIWRIGSPRRPSGVWQQQPWFASRFGSPQNSRTAASKTQPACPLGGSIPKGAALQKLCRNAAELSVVTPSLT